MITTQAKKIIQKKAIPALLNNALPAETVIRNLAAAHGVTATKTNIDKWCDDVSRLSGDDVVLDGVEQLLLNVDKLGLYNELALTDLHVKYLRERA